MFPRIAINIEKGDCMIDGLNTHSFWSGIEEEGHLADFEIQAVVVWELVIGRYLSNWKKR